jgi:hypothetical protein
MNTLYINGDAYELKVPPTLTEDILLPYEEDYPPMCLVQPTHEFTMEAEIDADVMNRLIYGVDTSQVKDQTAYTVMYSYKEQARRHKKKRINKKWAKRYGYITKQVCLNNVKIEME